MSYTLPELGYAYDALEPHFDYKQWKFTTLNTIKLM